jgi:hypothetical protein
LVWKEILQDILFEIIHFTAAATIVNQDALPEGLKMIF